jgi:hypothetical protein
MGVLSLLFSKTMSTLSYVQCPFCPERMYITKNMLFPRFLFQKPASWIDGCSSAILDLKAMTVKT